MTTPFELDDALLAGNDVEPLIGAEQTYPALEAAIAGAKSTVHMAYWLIEPELRPMSDVAHESWAELLHDTVRRGVTVRLVMSDFDPILGFRFHRATWNSYAHFSAIRERLPESAQNRLEVLCSRHEARVGTAVRVVGQPVIQKFLSRAVETLRAVARKDGEAAFLEALSRVPRLWPHIRRDADEWLVPVRDSLPTLYPAAHHEKLCVIDDRDVFLGGLDINERRRDTHQHDADLAWHDVACHLRGPAAHRFARHFRERWNYELPDFLSLLDEAIAPQGVAPLGPPYAGPVDDAPATAAEQDVGAARVAPLRTMSRQDKSSFSRSPRTEIQEIRTALLDIIGRASAFIYIEVQFLRSEAIVDALIARAEAVPSLQLILLLPLVPEDALVEEPDEATQYGQYLESDAIDRLRDALDGRFEVFTLTRAGGSEPDAEGAPQRTEREIVYVHAKTLVIDDEYAVIGSANLNDRSLLTDTETAIVWQEPDAVRRYRIALWRHALGVDVSDWGGDYLHRWREHAARNATVAAPEREGFVLPLAESAQRAHAVDSSIIPDELV